MQTRAGTFNRTHPFTCPSTLAKTTADESGTLSQGERAGVRANVNLEGKHEHTPRFSREFAH